jgi:hypothetical protein
MGVALRHVPRFNGGMPDNDTRIDFSAPAELRKWPSLNKQRVSASLGARPYLIGEGTLDECIQQFMQLRVRMMTAGLRGSSRTLPVLRRLGLSKSVRRTALVCQG